MCTDKESFRNLNISYGTVTLFDCYYLSQEFSFLGYPEINMLTAKFFARNASSLVILKVFSGNEYSKNCESFELTPVRAEFFQHWNAYCSFQ